MKREMTSYSYNRSRNSSNNDWGFARRKIETINGQHILIDLSRPAPD